MPTTLLVIMAVIGLGAVYVVLPVVANAYWQYRGVKHPVCPETGKPVEVTLNRRHAAATAAFGPPDLQVTSCSRWPERHDCAQGCTAGI